MAFEDPTYEIECRNELKQKINGQKLHLNTKSLISMHPSIVLNYINQYGIDATIVGINQAYSKIQSPSLRDLRKSIESFLE